MKQQGTLVDARDSILLDGCTPTEAIGWLRAFGGRGWNGGRTTWLPREDTPEVVFGDVDEGFVEMQGA